MTPLVAVDAWTIACETYKANFPGAKVLNERIEDINPLDHAKPETLDLILASPECTNHSLAKGAAERDETSRETVLHAVDWITKLRPRWFIIENVKEMRAWSRYQEIISRLEANGYRLSENVLNATAFGSPQARVRLFLVGGRDQSPPPIVPPQIETPQVIRDILDPHGTWAETPLFSDKRAKKTVAKARNAIAALGANAEFLLVYYGSGGEGSWQTLDQPLRTITTIDRFGLVRKKGNRYVMRMLQPSELARGMSVGNTHAFPVGSRREKVKLCGNGVCAAVVEHIVKGLREHESITTSTSETTRQTPSQAHTAECPRS
jgi:DNA (cytosine-5)-methyltransferase 1